MDKQGSIKRDARTGRFLVGRGAFAKISAVEGIRMSPEMKDDFAAFDRTNAPAAERRSALCEKYGAKKR